MASRFRVIDGPPSEPVTGINDFSLSAPTAGGEVDVVTGNTTWSIWPGKGTPLQVEAGATITAGEDLETDGQGRAVPQSSGTAVARALEGASSGQEFWAVWV